MDYTVTDGNDSSGPDVRSMNMYGEVKTKWWNRPKVVQSLKELEKIPTRRRKHICKLQKEKDKVKISFTFIVHINILFIYKNCTIRLFPIIWKDKTYTLM